MRKLLSIAAAAVVATVAFGASPASAQCPAGGGTVPGSPSKVDTVGAGGKTFYVDDRDFTDTGVGPDADDGKAGGLWIYMESGKKAGLQRGGDQIYFVILADNGVDPTLPSVGPIVIPAPAPVGPKTLFPTPVGGGSLSEAAGGHDDCQQDTAANRDNIVF